MLNDSMQQTTGRPSYEALFHFTPASVWILLKVAGANPFLLDSTVANCPQDPEHCVHPTYGIR